MQITITKGDIEIYKQIFEGHQTLNAVVALLMQQPAGDLFVTKVSNNGNDLTFRSSTIDIDRIVRSANGILFRAPAVAK